MVVGMSALDEVDADLATLRTPIDPALWDDLAAHGVDSP